MIGVWITLGIVAFFALILLLRASLMFSVDDDMNIKLKVAVLGIPVFALPGKEKKPKRYHRSVRAMKRHEEKKAAKAAKKQTKKQTKKQSSPEKKGFFESFRDSRPLSELIPDIMGYVKLLLGRLSKHLRIKIARLHITVATDDAAKTAILYGTVSQSVACFLEFLRINANTHYGFKPDVLVAADFASVKSHVNIRLRFSIGVWQVLDIALRLGWKYLKEKKLKKKADKPAPVPA